jgi:hypothetical protein
MQEQSATNVKKRRSIMIKVRVETESSILLEDASHLAIFAFKKGKLKGMLVHEIHQGWILRLGSNTGATGHHESLRACIEANLEHYSFFIEEK